MTFLEVLFIYLFHELTKSLFLAPILCESLRKPRSTWIAPVYTNVKENTQCKNLFPENLCLLLEVFHYGSWPETFSRHAM